MKDLESHNRIDSNPDFSPQEPTVQRVAHIRETLREGLWDKEMFLAYCLSGRDKKECKHIVLCLYDDYLDDFEAGRLGPGPRIRQHELLDAVYQAHLDEVSDFKKEYFAGMVQANAESKILTLNTVQQQVVEQLAFAGPGLESAEFLRLSDLLGEELALAARDHCASCSEPVDWARVLVTATQKHPNQLAFEQIRQKHTHDIFRPFVPEGARCESNHLRDLIDAVCRQRGIPVVRLRHRKGKG